MNAKEFFKSLIGLDIADACKKLGHWWVLESSHSSNGCCGFYHFGRAASGYVELRTDNLNRVISEHHNYVAELYQRRDLI